MKNIKGGIKVPTLFKLKIVLISLGIGQENKDLLALQIRGRVLSFTKSQIPFFHKSKFESRPDWLWLCVLGLVLTVESSPWHQEDESHPNDCQESETCCELPGSSLHLSLKLLLNLQRAFRISILVQLPHHRNQWRTPLHCPWWTWWMIRVKVLHDDFDYFDTELPIMLDPSIELSVSSPTSQWPWVISGGSDIETMKHKHTHEGEIFIYLIKNISAAKCMGNTWLQPPRDLITVFNTVC